MVRPALSRVYPSRVIAGAVLLVIATYYLSTREVWRMAIVVQTQALELSRRALPALLQPPRVLQVVRDQWDRHHHLHIIICRLLR